MAKTSVSKIRLKTKERLSIFSDLSTMLIAGIPIIEILYSLEADAKGNPKKVLAYMRSSLANGVPLSRALSQMPKAFDAVSVNLIRSAEAGGTLETTLRDIVSATKKEMAFSEQLRMTMIYPIFVMAVFLGIVVLMLTFVIPRVAEVFSSMHIQTPWITKVMIKASNLLMTHWLSIVIGIAIIAVFAVFFIKANKRLIIRSLLALPPLQALGTDIDLARFTRSFGLLMRSGVPIIESLKLSEKVVQKKSIIAVIQQMEIDVAAGKSISLSMRQPKSPIPTVMWRSIKTAETTGTLDQILQNLTEHFDDQVASSLKILSSLLEPVLIVVVGVLVGLLMVSIIAPIYNMISQINATPGVT